MRTLEPVPPTMTDGVKTAPGGPGRVKVTSPVKPARGETSIWNWAASPTSTSNVAGETVIEKSTTSRVMSTGWMSDPLVPTTARGNVPAVSVGTVRTLEPAPPTMTAGVKTVPGEPGRVKVTSPVKLPTAVTSIWNRASSPTITASVDGETVIEKSTTSSVMSIEWMSDPLAPTTARGKSPVATRWSES